MDGGVQGRRLKPKTNIKSGDESFRWQLFPTKRAAIARTYGICCSLYGGPHTLWCAPSRQPTSAKSVAHGSGGVGQRRDRQYFRSGHITCK
jgi:hypothetical protein